MTTPGHQEATLSAANTAGALLGRGGGASGWGAHLPTAVEQQKWSSPTLWEMSDHCQCQPGPAEHSKACKARSEHNAVVRVFPFSSLFKPNSFTLHANFIVY